jgi:predicted O-linked N-acetylglucosamine transferase (SPINDLY family)
MQRNNAADALAVIERASQAKNSDEAKRIYQEWLAQADSSHTFVVLFNLGVIQADRGELLEAAESYRKALVHNPAFLQSAFNLGNVLERLGQADAALQAWRSITSLPDDAKGDRRELLLLALNNCGRLLENEKRYDEAEEALTRSLLLDPEQPRTIHHWVHLRQKRCAWPVLKALPGLSAERLRDGASVLAMFDLSDDPAPQLAAARRYVDERVPLDHPPLAGPEPYRHKKLRIGYLSSDFCLHPVSLLMVELFEMHHRDRVAVYGFCFTREDGSDLRRRVVAAFDHYVRLDGMSDEAAARLIRECEIDVLVDLHGLTAGARPGILAWRPAPRQVGYLGLPGTSGMPFVDRILCDRYLIPEDMRRFYAEAPLYMPEVFQVCDGKRPVGPTPTRASCGLPEDGVVFCAFNNPHKYIPELFAVWMDILRGTPGSVLWLLGDSESIRRNLLNAANGHGIAPERLVFAPRALPPDYLARYRIADLFLDSYPFNGGTTANDALFMGLPIVTCSGRAFASRMAGSLLTSMGLQELITTNFDDYRELALALAADRPRLAALRRRVEAARATCPLFDTPGQARKIEDLFMDICGFQPAEDENGAADAATEARMPGLPRLDDAGGDSVASYRLDIHWVPGAPEALGDALTRLERQTTPGFFAADNLVTWGRNNWLLEDRPFRAAWQANQADHTDMAIVWRRYILACAGFHCAQIKGDFVECGIGHGTGVRTLLDYLGGAEFPKTFWAYANGELEPEAERRLRDHPCVRLVPGLLPQAMSTSGPERISLLHMNLHSSNEELAVLRQCLHTVTPGGMVILGSYEWAGADRRQKIELRRWLDERQYRVMPLPTGQGLLIQH